MVFGVEPLRDKDAIRAVVHDGISAPKSSPTPSILSVRDQVSLTKKESSHADSLS